MLLRWSFIYVLSVMILVLACLSIWQRFEISARISSAISLKAQIDTLHQLLTDAERDASQARRKARAAADRLAEERRAREVAESALAQAQGQIAELNKIKDAADEIASNAQAELKRERKASKLKAAIAARRAIARASGDAGAEPDSARKAVRATDVTTTLGRVESEGEPEFAESSPPAAQSQVPLPLKKPIPEVVTKPASDAAANKRRRTKARRRRSKSSAGAAPFSF